MPLLSQASSLAPHASLAAWLGFAALILLLVAADLLRVRRRGREPSLAESAASVALWCLAALAFNGFLAWRLGGKAALQFSTGYLMEWSMSMDNVFLFAVIFRYFQVPKAEQQRILLWGIGGAIVMRLSFILAGAAIISRFHFVLPLLGVFLVCTACQLAWNPPQRSDPRQNIVLRLARRWLPLAEDSTAAATPAGANRVDYGGPFLVRQAGRLRIAPPLLVLLVVEGTDLLFAVDSVPAIFGITQDAYLVFTSNVFAILGLRALYFVLAAFMDTFRYLHYGLAAVLAFVGLKMMAEGWLPREAGGEILPVWASLTVIAALLGAAIGASILERSDLGRRFK